MEREVTRRVYQIMLLGCLIACTALFVKEVNSSVITFANADKVAHFLIFFGLAFVLHHAFRLPVWLHLLMLAGYGAGIEVLQSMVPHRQASLYDFYADCLGALSYFAGYFVWRKYVRKRTA
ncbi:VanZ family protein [Pseudoalteromonas fenneropenaei]|uniref:VanZ family protein n=1 Tax=Pseudoalteromonas fenneropenaei TaxID=1737459 RepID=A0ABV7CM00_9GAMM